MIIFQINLPLEPDDGYNEPEVSNVLSVEYKDKNICIVQSRREASGPNYSQYIHIPMSMSINIFSEVLKKLKLINF